MPVMWSIVYRLVNGLYALVQIMVLLVRHHIRNCNSGAVEASDALNVKPLILFDYLCR